MAIPARPFALVRALCVASLICNAACGGKSTFTEPSPVNGAAVPAPAEGSWQAAVLKARSFSALEHENGFVRVDIQGQSPVELPARSVSDARGLLPAPSQLATAGASRRTSVFTDEQLVLDGSSLDPALAGQNLAPASGGLETTFDAGAGWPLPDQAAAAYALYRFNVPDFDTSGLPQSIGTLWAEDEIPAHYYLGLAHWASDRWSWFAGGPDCVVTLDSLADYIRADGTLLVTVIVFDDAPRNLLLLQLGAEEYRATGALLPEDNAFANFTTPQLYYDGKQTSLVNGAPAQHFINEAWVGPAYDQGQMLSCTACAVAGAYNYELSREYMPFWNPADDSMRMSPKWLYKETYLGACGLGRRGEDITGFCQSTGGCSMELAYYDGNCVADYDKPTCLAEAGLIKASGWKKLWDQGDWAIDEIKVALYEWEQPVIFTITLDPTFKAGSGWDPAAGEIWTWNDILPNIPRLHSMLIIGYDDASQAFLVRNSWGKDWGRDGNCWISYATFHTAAMRSCFVLKGPGYDDTAATHFRGGPSPNAVRPPRTLSVSTNDADKINLSWSAVPGASGYTIYRDKRSNLIATVDTTTFEDTGVTDFLTHSYMVRTMQGPTQSAAARVETGARYTPPQPPTFVNFGKSFTTASVGTTVQFLVTLDYSNMDLGSYSWSVDPPSAVSFLSTPGTQEPYLVLLQAGTHTAHFTVSTINGDVSDSFQFEVTTDPPVAAISAPTSAPYGTTIDFDASASTAPPGGTLGQYLWDLDGDSVPDLSRDTPEYSQIFGPGSHTIGLQVMDNLGELSAWATHSFIVHSWGSFRISADDAIQSWFAARMVNGRPAVAWFDSDEGTKLWYVRANDAFGTSWPNALDIASDPGGFHEVQLEMVNGSPAIAAITKGGTTSHDVVYLRASDAAGDSWPSPANLFAGAADKALSSLSLVVADGLPAVAFQESPFPIADSDRVLYIQSSDAVGTSWPSPSPILDGGATIRFMEPSLAVVSGNPALTVVMRDWLLPADDLQLQYTRSSDPDGDNWPAPLMLAGYDFGYPTNPQLAFITGRPSIAYYSQEESKAFFVRGTDATGSAWTTPADTGLVGSTFALGEVGGEPLLATVDSYELVFLQGQDMHATTWEPAVYLDVADGTYSLGLLTAGTKPLLVYADGMRAMRLHKRAGDF